MYFFMGGGVNWGSVVFDLFWNLFIVNVNSVGYIIKFYVNEVFLEIKIELGFMDGMFYKMIWELFLGLMGLLCILFFYGMLVVVDLFLGDIVWRNSVGMM